ncbi:hypothetical protein B0T24DRAFT_114442 [Lasiosphaeria ovina]|uniref:Uncharacterized protein n=1 Tax=Lasiosphaeria ovina TaxID=92902 RepID=A0AAE0JT71_9PEZI|nr:hypothetical protein B0T24DRAFT_114442 [Lasiosphaeria ovina]
MDGIVSQSLGPIDTEILNSTQKKGIQLAEQLYSKFQTSKDVKDLDSAILHARSAIEQVQTPSSRTEADHAGLLSLLGTLLTERYIVSSNPADARESTLFLRKSVEECPPVADGSEDEKADTDTWMRLLKDFRVCLDRRCRKTRQRTDVDEAIHVLEDLSIPKSDRIFTHALGLERAELCGLGYDLTDDIEYLEKGIAISREVCSDLEARRTPQQLAAENDKHFQSDMKTMEVLAGLLRRRFVATKKIADIDALIDHYQEMLRVAETPSPPLAGISALAYKLATTSMVRHGLIYERDKDFADLEGSLEACHAAMATRFAGHDSKALWDFVINGLKTTIHHWYEHTRTLPPTITANDVLGAREIADLVPHTVPAQAKATWLYEAAARSEARFLLFPPSADGSAAEAAAARDMEHAINLTARALGATDPRHPAWGRMETSLRRRRRMWSEHTGKWPEAAETVVLSFANGGVWFPAELAAAQS